MQIYYYIININVALPPKKILKISWRSFVGLDICITKIIMLLINIGKSGHSRKTEVQIYEENFL